jgi:hypothetical protein
MALVTIAKDCGNKKGGPLQVNSATKLPHRHLIMEPGGAVGQPTIPCGMAMAGWR